MKKLVYILFFISWFSVNGQNFERPEDFDPNRITIQLNDFKRNLFLLNQEFERTHSKEELVQRIDSVKSTTVPNNRIQIGDKYAIAIEPDVSDWLNTTIVKATSKIKGKKFQHIYEVNKDAAHYRYVIRYRFYLPKGDPLQMMMLFYLYDKELDKELIDFDSIDQIKNFRPIIYYTGEKMKPIYGMIKSFKVKKEFIDFFSSL